MLKKLNILSNVFFPLVIPKRKQMSDIEESQPFSNSKT